MIGLPIIWRLQTLAFAALAFAIFGAIECPPRKPVFFDFVLKRSALNIEVKEKI